jgi:chromosome partitioning protein
MVVVSVLNNKGGVGKTTVATWLSQALSITGNTVLCIDNDKQHNLTNCLGINKDDVKTSVVDLYKNKNENRIGDILSNSILSTAIDNLYCLPSDASLSHSLVTKIDVWKTILSNKDVQAHFDYVIFDNSPGTDNLQTATIMAADTIIIPTELQSIALQGLWELWAWLVDGLKVPRKNIKIIPNKYKDRIKDNSYLESIKNEYKNSVTTCIPYDQVFDDINVEEKILYLSRLRSKVVPYTIKVITEIFPKNSEKSIFDTFIKAQKSYKSDMCRVNFFKWRHNENTGKG